MNGRFTIPKLRWMVAGLLFAVTLINYIDRGALSALVGEVRQSLNLTNEDYSQIVSLFLIAYAIMYAVSGYVVDLLGTKFGMAIFVFVWSVFQILHGFAAGKWSFAACRFGLGLAEPGSFPAATKAIGEWFPPRQRALGVGIFNTGSSLGAAVAVWLAAALALRYNWRAAFIATGALGLLWVIAWLAIYNSPRRNRWLSDKEAAELNDVPTSVEIPAAQKKVAWSDVLFSRPGFMLILPRFLTDPVIYFVIFWLPAYLEKERGFNLQMIRDYGWIPYAFGGVGYIIGGLLSNRLMHAGWALGKSRKTAMTIGAVLLPAAIFAFFAPSAGAAIAAMCIVVLGHAIWVANLMTLPTDLFPQSKVATAAGFSGMGGAIAGALANWFTGSVVMHFSYLPIFICAGLLHPVAMLLIWWLLPERYFERK